MFSFIFAFLYNSIAPRLLDAGIIHEWCRIQWTFGSMDNIIRFMGSELYWILGFAIIACLVYAHVKTKDLRKETPWLNLFV